jgi:hypothetical protein
MNDQIEFEVSQIYIEDYHCLIEVCNISDAKERMDIKFDFISNLFRFFRLW